MLSGKTVDRFIEKMARIYYQKYYISLATFNYSTKIISKKQFIVLVYRSTALQIQIIFKINIYGTILCFMHLVHYIQNWIRLNQIS